MKQLFLLFILIISFACQSENKTTSNSTEQKSNDSISLAEKQAKRYADSLAISQRKQDAQIAYGKIKFGITEREYKKINKEYYQQIGDYEYRFNPIFDKQGKLYQLEIRGLAYTADKYSSTVMLQWRNLYDIISGKYSTSDAGSQEYPNFLNLQEGYYSWTNNWNIDTKRIDLGVLSSDHQYAAVVLITHKPTEEQLNIEAAQKSSKDKNKASDNF